ncbi:MAG: LysE family transporter [Alphaproteobacteria bacterium]|nr:LysE family transporter [Alphaproteobacteria bacterium]
MFSYILAVIVLTAIPGPGLLTIFGIGSAFGYRAGISFTVGVYLGANLTALIVFSGLSALLMEFPLLRGALFLLSLIYFTYLAVRIGFAGTELGILSSKVPRCHDGIMLMLFNPKAYLTMSALFLGFPLLSFNPVNEVIIKVIVANIVWVPGHLIWLYAGVKVNSLNLTPRAKRAINLILAAVIIFMVFGSAVVSMQTSA